MHRCQDTGGGFTSGGHFLGLSAGGVLKPDLLSLMAEKPLILALANPIPEILPEQVKAVRPDAIVATGRSDYPNQVNNVLCFPYIFRGALDCGATTVNRAMEIAAVHAIANLAKAEQSDVVARAYGIQNRSFGADYLIPLPFDPRLMVQIAPAVAKAAELSGVATRPIADSVWLHRTFAAICLPQWHFYAPYLSACQKSPGFSQTYCICRRGR